MFIEKEQQLESLSVMIEDFIDEYQKLDTNIHRIGDPHHILWAGNPESKIMVVNKFPSMSELSWAIKLNIHDKLLLTSPGGHRFRSAVKTAGFNVNLFHTVIDEVNFDFKEDLFFVNMIPFYPFAGQSYSNESYNKLLWIYNSVCDIIKPNMIVTLGYDVFSHIAKICDKKEFWELCEEALPQKTKDNVFYLPLEDPEIIIQETLKKKNKNFTLALKRLFINKELYMGGENE